ncbi:MAG: mechanosensitive ion channel family protein [Planctomycetota bacterium]|nr:mechanosensitive ion channel family protein [Planctomycetota bacterium]
MDELSALAYECWPFLLALLGVMGFWFFTRAYLDRRTHYAYGRQFARPLVMILVTLACTMVLILALPIHNEIRLQILKIFGIVISAMLAFSSATFVGNAMAGFMQRSIGSMRAGDYIKVGEFFGRISERGLFHTEIQTEQRDLVTIPNLFLASNPVTIIRTSGTIVHAEIGLGYNVPRQLIEEGLKEAVTGAELSEPYVQVVHLGDFAVTYRAGGFLQDVKNLITVRSVLREQMLDCLHKRGIEIVSPAFMNQRQLRPTDLFIPERVVTSTPQVSEKLPTKTFDKADQAEGIEAIEFKIGELQEKLAATEDAGERKQLETEKKRYEETLKSLKKE